MSKEEQSFFDMLLTKEEGSTKEGLVDVVKEVLVDVVKEVVEEETIPGQGGEEEIEPGASEEFFKKQKHCHVFHFGPENVLSLDQSCLSVEVTRTNMSKQFSQ